MKKTTGYLIILAVFCLFAVSAAYALDLQTHDFDGHFKMGVPKDASIKIVENSGGTVIYTVSNYDINITYYGNGYSWMSTPGSTVRTQGRYTIEEFPDGSNLVFLQSAFGAIKIRGNMPVDDMISMLDTVKFN